MADGFSVSHDDLDRARHAIESNAIMCGLDITEPKLKKFLENQINVIAWKSAETRHISNALNDLTFNR